MPLLAQMPLVAGVGCVARVGDTGPFKLQVALAEKRKRGWIVLPHDIDGPSTSYVTNPAPGVFVTRWETVFAGTNRKVVDLEGYTNWLRSLVDRGVFPQPPIWALMRLQTKTQGRIAMLQDGLHTTPSLGPQLKQAVRHLDVIDAEIERVQRPVVTGPYDPTIGSDLDVE